MRILLLWCCALWALAVEIDGVTVPSSVLVDGVSVPLRGADLLRWKWVVKIYVAACWLPAGSVDPLTATPARLGFTYRRGFSALDLAKATSATIVAGRSEAEVAALRPSLERWNAAYGEVVAGDLLTIDHLPGGIAVMTLNGQERLRLTDPAFAQALVAIWLGPSTFDADLRAGLLATP